MADEVQPLRPCGYDEYKACLSIIRPGPRQRQSKSIGTRQTGRSRGRAKALIWQAVAETLVGVDGSEEQSVTYLRDACIKGRPLVGRLQLAGPSMRKLLCLKSLPCSGPHVKLGH